MGDGWMNGWRDDGWVDDGWRDDGGMVTFGQSSPAYPALVEKEPMSNTKAPTSSETQREIMINIPV